MADFHDDGIDPLYISDIETYDLLYLNAPGRELFGVGPDDDITGFKCYEFLQHRDAPCPFCTNRLLTRDECYVWEYTNPITGVRHLLNDRLIDWNGRDARIEIGFEITARKEEGMRFRNLHQSEQIILDCVSALYRETDAERAAENMVRRLGEELKAQRTLIITHDGGHFNNTHEWCAEGVIPRKGQLQGISDRSFGRWIELFERGECVVIENLREIKDTIGGDEYRTLDGRGIDSIVAAPIEQNGEQVGCLAIENPPGNIIRDIAPLLRTLCYFYMMTLQRIENQELLVQLGYHDSMTGLLNRNRYIEDIDALADWAGSLGVIFLDVNGMKEINDRNGHAVGDRLLSECADTMRTVLGEAFTLYRIGGDEFVAIATDIDEDAFRKLAETLDAAFDQNPLCQVAVGSRWEQHPSDVSTMLLDADEAMYRDKQLFYRNAITASTSAEPEGANGGMPRTFGAAWARHRTGDDADARVQTYGSLADSIGVGFASHVLDDDFSVVWSNRRFNDRARLFSKMEPHEPSEQMWSVCSSEGAAVPEGLQGLAEAALAAGEAGFSGFAHLLHEGQPIATVRILGMFSNVQENGRPLAFVLYFD